MVDEAGPWYILTRVRSMFGIIHDEQGRPIAYPDNSVLACIWCLSPWVGLALLGLPTLVWVVFAVSALAIIIEERLV